MNTGRAPRHWTLYGVASLSPQACRRTPAGVDRELQESGVLEHRECPLIRVGNERHPLVAQHSDPLALRVERAQRLEGVAVPPLCCDHLAGVHEPLLEAVGRKRIPVGEALGSQAAEHLALELEDSPVRVAERPAVRGRDAIRPRARRAQVGGTASPA